MSLITSAVRTPSQPRPGKKYFTLAEAQRALPLIKRIAVDIQATQKQRLRLHAELSGGLAHLTSSQQDCLQKDFDHSTDRLASLIEELTKIGVQLKDPSRALLDFPSLFQGREVLLCWKADEETISHWHEVEGGLAGRKPIETLHD